MLIMLLPLLLLVLLRLRLVLVVMPVLMVVLVLLPQWRLMVLRPLVGERCPCPFRSESLFPVVVLPHGGRPLRVPDHRH
jgi:hypothetical protein